MENKNMMKTNMITGTLNSLYFNPEKEVKGLWERFKEKAKDFKFKSWGILFLKVAGILILIKLLLIILLNGLQEYYPELENHERSAIHVSVFGLFLFAMLEEFMFRLPMKHNYLFLFISIYSFVQHLIPGEEWSLVIYGGNNIILRSTIYFSTTMLIFPLLKIVYKPKLIIAWMVISCIGFSLVHLRNYASLDLSIHPICILKVLPQLITGMIFLYTRLRMGIGTSIILHFSSNGLLLLLPPILNILE